MPSAAAVLGCSLALAASPLLLPAEAKQKGPPPRCPAFLGTPQLQVKTGRGALDDTSLKGLNEVVWVGPECLEVFAGSPGVHKLPGDGSGWLFSHDFFATGAGLDLCLLRRESLDHPNPSNYPCFWSIL